MRVEDSSLELKDWLDVNDTRDVKSHVEETREERVLQKECDLEVTILVEEGKLVYNLDDDVLVCVDLLWHPELNSHVGERDEESDSCLLRKLLMLLD